MRFYWKELPDAAEQGIACKIMRAVEFPFKYDIRDECTKEEQQAMNMVRNVIEGEDYQECMKECEDSPELKDAMLQSLLDEDVKIRASSQMPAGFAGFYEKVTAVTKQTIKQLKGGSEAHSVYLCFYRFIDSNQCSVC